MFVFGIFIMTGQKPFAWDLLSLRIRYYVSEQCYVIEHVVFLSFFQLFSANLGGSQMDYVALVPNQESAVILENLLDNQ